MKIQLTETTYGQSLAMFEWCLDNLGTETGLATWCYGKNYGVMLNQTLDTRCNNVHEIDWYYFAREADATAFKLRFGV